MPTLSERLLDAARAVSTLSCPQHGELMREAARLLTPRGRKHVPELLEQLDAGARSEDEGEAMVCSNAAALIRELLAPYQQPPVAELLERAHDADLRAEACEAANPLSVTGKVYVGMAPTHRSHASDLRGYAHALVRIGELEGELAEARATIELAAALSGAGRPCFECDLSTDVDGEGNDVGTCVCTLFEEACPNEGPCVDETERDAALSGAGGGAS